LPATAFPANPNGSELSLAGLTDPSGQILGLMPHPEAFISRYTHPSWPRLRREDPGPGDEGDGLAIFRNAVEWMAGRRTP
ncbi:MAG: phosphoribosylformylglycinamidine synthase subunit PurQ, partial [Deltaproteobacteria bacterium]|nr:phosphoribosylformylglycinamidine synthase subunit PurQ [Deltaproteobacteria bacterium]